MSISELNTPIQIIRLTYGKDAEGFKTVTETVVACVRAKKEDKNLTEKWSNRTVLKDVSTVFRFRYIPGVEIDNRMVIDCCDGRYNIISVENVRGRNMYYEVAARLEVTPSGEDDA